MSALATVFAVALALCAVLVAAVRWYAVRRNLVDHPGDRSSHAIPTPRGGGAGVILAVFAVLVAWRADFDCWKLALALAGVAVVALIGWMDDHRSLSASQRIGVHIVGAACVGPLAIGPHAIPVVLALAAWWVFWGVAAVNVVNFMDGSDGFIGAQLLVVGAYVIALSTGARTTGVLGAAMSGAAIGFLLWNWPPARIFLGDVGSGAIGLLIVVAGVALMRVNHIGLVRAFLPLFPIFLDAAWTLARRASRRVTLTEAHREHLYQRMANGGLGHAWTALLFACAATAGAAVGTLCNRHFALLATTYFVVGIILYAIAGRRWPADPVSVSPRSARSRGTQ